MSEYWKSTPKYWCKHCSTYVKDTTLERKQHENTGKHQGNLKRFLQGIQKDHVKMEREKDKAKAEVDRLNRVVGSKSTPAILSSTSLLPPSRTSSSKSLSVTDQKRQWAQLAEMGISVPDSARAEVAMAGDWQTISRRIEPDYNAESKSPNNETLNIGVKKRKIGNEEEEVEVKDNRNIIIRKGWGSATKSYPGQQQEDLDALFAIPITKKTRLKADADTTPDAEGKQKSVKSEHDDEEFRSTDSFPDTRSDLSSGKPMHENEATTQQCDLEIKHEPGSNNTRLKTTTDDQGIAIPLFKKRKAKAVQS